MPLKLLGGVAKGQILTLPKPTVRPTAVLLKRRLFDFQQNWQGRTVFDLCAGSGALGLEAWSRGAAKVHLVDSSPQALTCLKSNTETLQKRFPEESSQRPILIKKRKLPQYLNKLKKTYLSFDLSERQNAVFFFDPPYDKKQLYHEVCGHIFTGDWFCGQFILEFDRQLGDCPFGRPARLFCQGDRSLALFLFGANSTKLELK